MVLSKQTPIEDRGGAGTTCGGYPCGNFTTTECSEHIHANPNNYPEGATSTTLNTTSANDVKAAHTTNPSP